MRSCLFLVALACTSMTASIAQDATLSAVGQSIQGTWIAQLTDASGNLQLFEVGTFHPDGSYSGANVNPTHTEHKGVWVRTGDRKFLMTVIYFTRDDRGAFNGIVKARLQITLAADLKSFESVAERVVMDTTGKELQVTPGFRGRSVRMDLEEPRTPAP
jgi:hypothetical protein